MANINGQPNRIPSSSNLFMKKRDRKQKKKRGDFKIAEAKDVDGIGQLAADHYFSYDSSSGLVARLSMYGIDSFTQQQEPFLEKPERVKIEAEDWSQLAEGPCLGDCCGDDCDEVRYEIFILGYHIFIYFEAFIYSVDVISNVKSQKIISDSLTKISKWT